MNREIKFRVWDRTEDCYKHPVLDITHNFPDYSYYTYQQFTGERDIKRTKEFPKGQEIYEGDIIKWYYADFEEPNISVITYSGNSFSFPGGEWEVIGNINEHKHLLPQPTNN